MNVLNFPCNFCKEELSAPIFKSLTCGDNFHEKCFDILSKSEFPICDKCYAPVNAGMINFELQELVSKIDMLKKPWGEEATPEQVLNEAVQAGETEVVHYLLNQGIELPEQSMLIHDVIATNDRSALEIMLESGGKECIDAQDEQGRTALVLAVQYGAVDDVALLLQAGADPYIGYEDHSDVLSIAREQYQEALEGYGSDESIDECQEIIHLLEDNMGVYKKRKVHFESDSEIPSYLESESASACEAAMKSSSRLESSPEEVVKSPSGEEVALEPSSKEEGGGSGCAIM